MRFVGEIQYDGTDFHGWQIQPNARSVQELVEEKLSMILNAKTSVMGCGRTDTGVHAKQFFLHFDREEPIPTDLAFRMNQVCGSAVSFQNFWSVPEEMHVRFSAISRTYRYYIRRKKDPFAARYSYLFKPELDLTLLQQAAEILRNYSEFGAFCKSHASSKTNTCVIFLANWQDNGDELVFEIKADRFLRNMVRAIVGTILQVGQHKMDLSEFAGIIEGGNRSNAGDSAPAHGLFLEEVEYDKTNWELIG
ncbi:MAG: tRNA pseudouridine(38-40) synthase TruA [Flavobacteriales bacterium]|nr:tRNA pseudouridine(38-40) synthase TruA [Flavobacteriales bacterium]